jgi:hypothetical protein
MSTAAGSARPKAAANTNAWLGNTRREISVALNAVIGGVGF